METGHVCATVSWTQQIINARHKSVAVDMISTNSKVRRLSYVNSSHLMVEYYAIMAGDHKIIYTPLVVIIGYGLSI